MVDRRKKITVESKNEDRGTERRRCVRTSSLRESTSYAEYTRWSETRLNRFNVVRTKKSTNVDYHCCAFFRRLLREKANEDFAF